MARLVLAHDWASTPIGPISSWSMALRTAVSTCLATNFPVLVMWGPQLVKIYNDGYSQMIGRDKHPRALGAPALEIWPEIWDTIGPMFDSVLTTGVATWSEREQLVIERNGFPEECYFTFSYSPLFDDDGRINGILDIAVETTGEVVNERRLSCIADLTSRLVAAEQVADACVSAVRVLRRHRTEIAAADLFLQIDDRLLPVASNRRYRVAAVPMVDVHAAVEAREPMVIGQIGDDGPASHHVVPFFDETGAAAGTFVASLNPHRPFDDDYRRFVEVIAQTIGGVVERVQRRTQLLGDVQHVNDTLQRAMLPTVTDTPLFAARYVPAVDHLSVGGDWYDVVDLPDDRRALIVGDCVGHGLEAATAMSQLRSATRALLLEGHDPAAAIEALDTFASSVDGCLYASIVCVVSDHRDRTLTYCRAGHPPPLFVRPNGTAWLDASGGPLLGVETPGGRDNTIVRFDPGDLVVLYTDGLIDERRADDDLETLVRLAASGVGGEVTAVADGLLSTLVTDDTTDDVVVVVKRLAGEVDRVVDPADCG